MAPTLETALGLRADSITTRSRLDYRQVFQFQRQTVGLQCLLEDRDVEVLCAKHIAYRASQPAAVSVDEFLYDIIVRHLDDGRDAAQSLLVDFLVVDGIHVGHIAVCVGLQICLGVVQMQEAVHLRNHALGQVYHFFLALGVGNCYLCLVALCLSGVGEAEHGSYDDSESLLHSWVCLS